MLIRSSLAETFAFRLHPFAGLDVVIAGGGTVSKPFRCRASGAYAAGADDADCRTLAKSVVSAIVTVRVRA
jgi:hypothetical protein